MNNRLIYAAGVFLAVFWVVHGTLDFMARDWFWLGLSVIGLFVAIWSLAMLWRSDRRLAAIVAEMSARNAARREASVSDITNDIV